MIESLLAILAASLVLLAAALVYVTQRLRRRNRLLDAEIRDARTTGWHAPLFYYHLDIRHPLPEPGDMAVNTDFLLNIMSIIADRNPKIVVELGSGLSTIIAALTLKKVNHGRLCSIDHLEEYGAKTREQLALHGLSDIAEVRFAPLKMNGTAEPWYDQDVLADLKSIDLLIVDGPPDLTGGRMTRYPALGFFWDQISDNGIVILDDVDRESERRAVNQWKEAFPSARFEHLPLAKGAVLIEKR